MKINTWRLSKCKTTKQQMYWVVTRVISKIEVLVYPFFDDNFTVHTKAKLPIWEKSAQELPSDGLLVILDDSYMGKLLPYNVVNFDWRSGKQQIEGPRVHGEYFFDRMLEYLGDRLIITSGGPSRYETRRIGANNPPQKEFLTETLARLGIQFGSHLEMEVYGLHYAEAVFHNGRREVACVHHEGRRIAGLLGIDESSITFNRTKSVRSLFSALRVLLREHVERYQEMEERAGIYVPYGQISVPRYPDDNNKLRQLEDYLYSGHSLWHLRKLSRTKPTLDEVIEGLKQFPD